MNDLWMQMLDIGRFRRINFHIKQLYLSRIVQRLVFGIVPSCSSPLMQDQFPFSLPDGEMPCI